MNRWIRMALATSALFVISAPLLAQTPATAQTPTATTTAKGAKKGGQARRAGLANLPVSAIDSLVTLTDDQKVKITGIQDRLRTDVAAASGDAARIKDLNGTATADVKAVLTPDQQKVVAERMPIVQLLNQSKAIPMAALGSVKLTADQMAKIKTAATATQDKMKAVAKEDRKTQNPTLLAEFKTQVDAILTADQKLAVSKAGTAKGKKKKAA